MISQELEKAILKDIEERVEIAPQNITISKQQPANLPPNAQLFRAEKKGSHGNIYYNYIVITGQLYSSADDKSLARLLETEQFLNRPHWNSHQFATIFLHLVVRDPRLVESAAEITFKSDATLMEKAAQITPPTLEVAETGATASFWTFLSRYKKIEHWQVTISAKYQVKHQRTTL